MRLFDKDKYRLNWSLFDQLLRINGVGMIQ